MKPFVMLLISSSHKIWPLIIETKSSKRSFELISLFILFTRLLYSFWWYGPALHCTGQQQTMQLLYTHLVLLTRWVKGNVLMATDYIFFGKKYH